MPRMICVALCATLAISTAMDAAPTATQPGSTAIDMDNRGLVVAAVRESLGEHVWRITQGRTDSATVNERAEYARERSDATLKSLAELGVTMVVFPVCGYGDDAVEADEWPIAAEFARKARGRGLAVGVWLPLGSVRASRWNTASRPIDEWLVHDATGKFPLLDDADRRYLDRFAPVHVSRVAQMAQRVLREIKPDAVFLPEFLLGVGYEPHGVEAFRDWLSKRSDARGAANAPPPTAASTDSRLLERWMRFRAGALSQDAAALRRTLDAAGGTATRIGLETPIAARPPALDLGPCSDPLELARSAGLVWDHVAVQQDVRGHVHHQIAELKALGEVGVRAILPGKSALDVAQSMAFGRNSAGCLAYFSMGLVSADALGRGPVRDTCSDLAHFLTRHAEFYRGARRVADAVLLAPEPFDPAQPPDEQALFDQTAGALVSHRVPFTVCLDPEMSLLRDTHVLVLAGASRLSDAQVARIRRHVEAGGPLVIVGPAGTRDANGAPRKAGLLGALPASAPFSASAPGDAPRGLACREIGKARIVLLDRPGPVENCWLNVGRSRMPVAGRADPADDEFYSALRWAAGGRLSVECRFNGGSAIELSGSADGKLLILHVVNYDARHAEDPTDVRLRLPAGRTVRSVFRHVAAGGEHAPVKFRQVRDSLYFRTERCALYDLYEVILG